MPQTEQLKKKEICFLQSGNLKSKIRAPAGQLGEDSFWLADDHLVAVYAPHEGE